MFTGEVIPLSSLKKNRYIVEHIIWDFDPRQLVPPRCPAPGAEPVPKLDISGFILYIEAAGRKPSLSLMLHKASGYAETVAGIEGVPDQLLSRAIQENKAKEFCGMYPMNKELKDWLEKCLGIQAV
jgi:hypothetical protein